ncbi:MAG: MBOAT family protein [Planctomycetes bacterium]|nr:MBOAT family protein [Planctomycetota bacterium]
MLFSSPLFLFAFLPALLLLHALAPRRARNGLLLLASLLFFGWGEPVYLLLMLGSIAGNWWFGLRAERALAEPRALRRVVGAATVFNLGLLGAFKYADWLLADLGRGLAALGLSSGAWPSFATLLGESEFAREWLLTDDRRLRLPLGISFFTFQAFAYVLDVARGDLRAEPRLGRVALYVSLFPQLVAGPIVRYRDVAAEIVRRTVTREGFAYGVRRFVIGLAKKVLIANVVAVPADLVFGLPSAELTGELAWLGVVAYTLQIYFDFSGYSDMAIGLGHLFGFRVLENFRHPYVARSITEFWRRWHISLSTWFRDYLYVPLGGNRRGEARTHFNLVTVFALCGLWHGASWTFVAWGLYHGLFLVVERAGIGARLERLPRALRHGYVLLVVIVGWVLFRADDFGRALEVAGALFGAAPWSSAVRPLAQELDSLVVCALLAGALGATPWLATLQAWHRRATEAAERPRLHAALDCCGLVAVVALFWLAAVQLASSAYNPFIYFRF